MFHLVHEDLTGLGGPMGTETTTEYSIGYFGKLSSAKHVAEMDYGQPIDWVQTDRGYRSPDLGYVMYHINVIELEDA